MLHSVEAGLKRLETDRIDLYFVHMDDFVTPMEEIARGIEDLARVGKIVYDRLRRRDSAWHWIQETGVPRFQRHKVSEERLRRNDELNRQNDELQKCVSTAGHDPQESLRTIAAHCQVVTAHYDGHLKRILQRLSNLSREGSSACRP
jgi:Aldo/keto reductase family